MSHRVSPGSQCQSQPTSVGWSHRKGFLERESISITLSFNGNNLTVSGLSVEKLWPYQAAA